MFDQTLAHQTNLTSDGRDQSQQPCGVLGQAIQRRPRPGRQHDMISFDQPCRCLDAPASVKAHQVRRPAFKSANTPAQRHQRLLRLDLPVFVRRQPPCVAVIVIGEA
ncbi:hypothetical protein D3C72_1407070 [compost metagenome]